MDLETILRNALSTMTDIDLSSLPERLIPFLADVADGDARQALNSLELALEVCRQRTVLPQVKEESGHDSMQVDLNGTIDEEMMEAVKRGLRKGYDRTGEERYDMISALHKSIRASDGSAALYWLAR